MDPKVNSRFPYIRQIFIGKYIGFMTCLATQLIFGHEVPDSRTVAGLGQGWGSWEGATPPHQLRSGSAVSSPNGVRVLTTPRPPNGFNAF